MISFFWDNLLVNPMTNALIALDHLLFGNFGLAILAFTIVVRALTFPLTMRQLHSTRAMSELQPKIKEIQKKYKDPKRRNQETMRLYKEGKVNPLGCLLPMLIQFPVWIALYQVIRLTLAGAPENYVDLSQRLVLLCLHPARRSRGQHLPLVGPGPARHRPADLRGPIHVGTTALDDVNERRNQPTATADEQHDALDDASDVRVVQPHRSLRPCLILAGNQPCRHHHERIRVRIQHAPTRRNSSASSRSGESPAPRSHRVEHRR